MWMPLTRALNRCFVGSSRTETNGAQFPMRSFRVWALGLILLEKKESSYEMLRCVTDVED